MNRELKLLLILIAAFAGVYYLPVEQPRFQVAVIEALRLSRWYAREHVLLCLVPAFFIAGAIGVFISRQAVMRYFGPKANKVLAYGVASVSGTILAVCSCTVLPLFGSIYMRGAGLGPAIAFLYSGPAINVLAIILTARVLGWQLGAARAVGAISFSIIIGLLMHLFFRKEAHAKLPQLDDTFGAAEEEHHRPLWQVSLYFLSMVGILVFANWSNPGESNGLWFAVFKYKWHITAGFFLLLGLCLWKFFAVNPRYLVLIALPPIILARILPAYPVVAFTAAWVGLAVLTFCNGVELREWRDATWRFGKQITPLLFAGVLAAGFFLGSPAAKDAGIIPDSWIRALVGDSPQAMLTLLGHDTGAVPSWLGIIWPVWTNFVASFVGAFMYFATLTEVPILRGLMDSGMGQGPALALLLAGPSLSLPSMLVIGAFIGPKKTAVYAGLVVVMATITGIIFGALVK